MHCLINISVLFTLLTLTNIAWSTPILYNFEANSPSDLPFLPSLAGPVTGSFQYDSETPASGTIAEGRTAAGATIYESTITDLTGFISGNRFTDVSGGAVIGNGAFDAAASFPLPGADFFLLSFDDINGLAQNLNGFSSVDDTFGLLTLINVRMFWIENRNGVTGFLSDNLLTDVLPTFSGGMLALDFQDSNGSASSLFYNLQISAVNVDAPSVFIIFLMSFGLMGLRIQRRKL